MAENNGVLIETISKQAFEDMNKLISLLDKQITLVNTLTKDFKELKLPSQVSKAQKETTNAIKETNKSVSDYTKTLRTLENAQKRNMQASSGVVKETIRLRTETNRKNKVSREDAKLTSKTTGAYDKLRISLSRAEKEYRDLAVTLGETNKKTQEAEKRVLKLRNASDKVNKSIGRANDNVGNYGSALKGLKGVLTGVIGAFGVIEGLRMGFQFAKDSIQVARAAKGIEFAFNNLGATAQKAFEDVKASTNGLLSDLSIKKNIILFDNFNISLEQMGDLMEFAAVRSTQTGESMERLAESIATGLGRESVLILDNLGINTKELRDTMDTLGVSMTEAFSILAKREVAEAGDVLNEAASATERWNAAVEDFSVTFGDFLANGSAGSIVMDALITSLGKLSTIVTSLNLLFGSTGTIMDKVKVAINGISSAIVSIVSFGFFNEGFFEDDVKDLKSYQKSLNKVTGEIKAMSKATSDAKDASKDWFAIIRGDGEESIEKAIEGVTRAALKQVEAIKTVTEREEQEVKVLKAKLAVLADILEIETDSEKALQEGLDPDGVESIPVTITKTGDTLDKVSEQWQNYASVATDAISLISQAQKSAFDKSISQLDTEMQIALQFAGDGAEARAEIEERYSEKKKQLQIKQFKQEKKLAILQANLNAATAVVKTFAELGWPAGIAGAAIVTALTAAEIAIIKSQQVPAFAEGTMNSPEGMALVNDANRSNYKEVIVNPKGEVFRPQGRNQLVNLEKGSKVFKSEQDFDKELGGLLGSNGINSYGVGAGSPIINVQGNTLSKEDMEQAFKNALGNRPNNNVIIDKNGISTYAVAQLTKVNRLNNRVTFKGKNV